MKFSPFVSLPLILSLSACGGSSDSSDLAKVSFEDAGLASCWSSLMEQGTVSSVQEIKVFHCASPQTRSIAELTQLPNLQHLNLSDTILNTSEFHLLPKLTSLVLANIRVTEEVDLTQNLSLEHLLSWGSEYDLNISGLQQLQGIDLAYAEISQVTTGNNYALESFRAPGCKLEQIDLSSMSKLRVLDLGENRLQSLDISNNPELQDFWAYDNRLEAITISANLQLRFVNLRNNQIEAFDVSSNSGLDTLLLEGNPLNDETRAHLGQVNWIDNLEF